MEGWMISAAIAIGGVIFTYGMLRSSVQNLKTTNDRQEIEIKDFKQFQDSNTPLLAHLDKTEDQFFERINKQSDDITTLKEKQNAMPTMKEVRAEFVSKELFLQIEKHIDRQFNSLDGKLETILKKIEDNKQ